MASDTRSDLHAANGGRSLGELFRDLSRELGTLLRQESELARAELREKASELGRGAATLGAGGVVAFAGFLLLLHAAAYALAPVFESLALGALVVGATALVIGLLLLAASRRRLQGDRLAPKRSVESLRRDAELVRTGHAPPDPHGRT